MEGRDSMRELKIAPNRIEELHQGDRYLGIGSDNRSIVGASSMYENKHEFALVIIVVSEIMYMSR